MDDTIQYTKPKTQTVKFTVKLDKGPNPEFVGQKDEMLQDAMKGINDRMPSFCFTDYILFAEIEGHPGKLVAVLPNLLCGWIKNASCIHIEKTKEAVRQLTGNREDRSTDRETLFFIKNDDRYCKDAITAIRYQKYKLRELCVSAVKGYSFDESLKNDGRFINVEAFQITNDKSGTSPALDAQAQYYHNGVFSVSVIRSRKRKSFEGTCSPAPLTCLDDEGKDNRIQSDNNLQDEERHQTTIKEEAAVEEDDFPVPFSPPPLKSISTNDILNIIIKIAKSKVFEMLLSPEEITNKEQRDQAICHLVEQQFSKTFTGRRPTWLLEKLSSASKSVGRIFFERKTGTCFLLTKDIAITNLHVLCDIQNEMKNSTGPVEERKIRVRFNHIRPNQVDDLCEVFVQEIVASSADLHLDYVLLRVTQPKEPKDLEGLGPRVRCNVPDDGSLTIIGHPDGQEKVEETCRVVSTYLWRNEALQRVQNRRPPDVQRFDQYFFSCKEEAMSTYYNHKIAYDTSFFDGASGSPCINNDGHIVGMHTRGYIVKEMEQKVSIMEFGVSFKAIYADLKERYGEDLAIQLFPNAAEIAPAQMFDQFSGMQISPGSNVDSLNPGLVKTGPE